MVEFILQYIPYILIPIAGGIVLSYATEALDNITPEWFKSKYSLFIFSVVIIFIETKAFQSYYYNLYGFIFGYIANIVVALGFYKKYGKKFVEGVGTFVLDYLKKFLNQKIKKR
jgi:peptidoglycan biosynthesis protein MviN/MurJ (putative lipid II flippase)